MGKPKTPVAIVRIRITFRVLVVDTMVQGPGVGISLAGDRKQEDKNYLQRQFGLIRIVGPESVDTSSDSESGEDD